MIRRRTFVAGALSVYATPLAAQGPPTREIARIGFLSAETAAVEGVRLEAVRAGLRDLGYVEGKNIVIEARWAEGNYDRLPDLAAELVRLKVDVLVTVGTKAVLGAKRATTTVPIVMGSSGDIVAIGLVASLARPGGNITGSTNAGRELGPKRLELLREASPRITRAAYLVNPANPAFGPNLQAMWTTARSLNLELQPFEARGPSELRSAFSEMTKRQMNAVVVQDETSFSGPNARAIADLATKNRLPLAGGRGFGDAGGLIGYGANVRELERRAAVFVDRILKGAKPADLPIEQPSTFELVVNVKTANAIGLRVPQELRGRADVVID